MVGQTVGKYRILSRLGRGGMGTVYKAVDETLDREVAIKSLNADLSFPDLLKRFRAEAIALARLNHPNIATLYELAEHDGQLLMVMEFVRGQTFDKLSQREGPMSVGRAAQLCAQVLDALEHAHRAGIVHRDLKPANLMLTEAGLVKVMDFGLARMVGTEHLTNAGYMVGTPAYMSPEQVLGRDIDGRADIYAMGVVLFRLLTAQLPFKAESGIAMVQHQLNDPPTSVRQLRSDLSDVCDSVVMRALAKIAGDRYQTAEEFKSALARLDPSAISGVSRISVVAPVPASVAGDEPTLLPTPTPLASAAAGLPPVTVMLPRAEPGGRTTEVAKAEVAKTDVAKAEVAKIDVARTEIAKTEEAKAEDGKTEDGDTGEGKTEVAAPQVAPSAHPAPSRPNVAAAISSSAPAQAKNRQARSAAVPLAIAVAVLLAGVPVVLFWRAHRAAQAAATQAAADAATHPPAVSSAPPATPPPPAVPPPDTAAPSAVAAPPGVVALPVAPASGGASAPVAAAASRQRSSAPATAAVAKKPSAVAAKPVVGNETAAKPTADTPVPATPAVDTPAARPTLPDVTFAKLKLLIVDDAKRRDRDASLKLGRDALAIVDGDTTLHTAPYGDVIGVYYSHSKEPRWATPNGQSLSVGKPGGAFGFFRGTPDWVTLRTKTIFIPLRVREDEVRKLLDELESRIGTKAVSVK